MDTRLNVWPNWVSRVLADQPKTCDDNLTTIETLGKELVRKEVGKSRFWVPWSHKTNFQICSYQLGISTGLFG